MVSGQDMIVYGVTRHDCTCVRVQSSVPLYKGMAYYSAAKCK